MMTPHPDQTTIAHVAKAVFRHDFCSSADWSRGIDELGELTDSEIELIVASDAAIEDEIEAITSFEDEDGQFELPLFDPRPLSDPDPLLTYEQQATFCLLMLKGLDRKSALADMGASV